MNKLEIRFKQKTNINFKEFYKTQKPKLIWYLTRWTNNFELSEDIADDAFIQALKKIDSFDETKSQIHTWLYTIAKNIATKNWKEKQRLSVVSMDKELKNGTTTLNLFLSYNDTINEKIMKKTIVKKAEIVRTAIYNLPEKQIKYRTVLIMREINNMSYNEISNYLKLNLSTVKSQIKKGRELIVKKVERDFSLIDKYGIN